MSKEGPIFFKAPAFAKALVLALCLPAFLRAQERLELSYNSVLVDLVHGSADYFYAPFRWSEQEWRMAGAATLGLGLVVASDQPLRQLWRGGRPDLDATMPLASHVGEGWVLASLSAGTWGLAALIEDDTLAEASSVALQALALSGLGTLAGKYAFGSVRPSTKDDAHHFGDYGRPYGQLSFPSGHSFSAFAAAEAWGSYYGRWWTYPLAATIAYSRVYNNAHWPSDVLAGAVLGVAAGRMSVRRAEMRKSAQASGPFTLVPGPEGGLLLTTTRHF